jgi:hypothetical protein
MFIYSLDTLSKEEATRIAVELLVVFVVITVVKLLAVEPILQSLAPGVYTQSGLDYSRLDLPNTASEVTHLLSTVVVVGLYLFWRLDYTELGKTLSKSVVEDYDPDR